MDVSISCIYFGSHHSLTLAPTATNTTVSGTQLLANIVAEICAEGIDVSRG